MKLTQGMKIGKLTLLELQKSDKGKYGWLCKCDCGNTKWIRSDSLTKSNRTESCGCLSKATQTKPLEIKEQKFNRLLAIRPLRKEGRIYIWEFKCDCGNIIERPATLVANNRIKSCGCLAEESILINAKKGQEIRKKRDLKEHTDLRVIKRSLSEKLIKSNTSGITGVAWDSSRHKWIAQIEFQGKHIHLGRFDSKEGAIKVRRNAEEKYFKEMLEKYERYNR